MEKLCKAVLEILSILAIIFVVLKLLGIAPVIDWSWWLVLSPALAAIGLGVIVFIYTLIWGE